MENHNGPAPVKADGSTIFVLGNGPSLAAVDFDDLTPFSTIGMNAAYRHWHKIEWRPTHYACLDLVVGLSHKEAIADLIQEGIVTKFLLRANLIEALGDIAADPRVVNFDALKATEKLLQSPAITTGSHTVLWAAIEGYHKIILLGIDGQYQERVEGAVRREGTELEIVSQPTSNPNYFFEDYQQPGDRYNIPNPRPGLHMKALRTTAALLQKEKATVYNGNFNSSVRCFPFVNFKKLLCDGSDILPADELITSEEIACAHNTSGPPNIGRAQRLVNFIRSNWILCFSPIAIYILTAYAITRAFEIDAGILALLTVIIFFAGSLWLALLFTRNTSITHISQQHEKIASLEASVRDLNKRHITNKKNE